MPKKASEVNEDRTGALSEAWEVYSELLEQAKVFHAELDHYKHPETYQFYSSDVITADGIDYTRTQETLRGKHAEYLPAMQRELKRTSKEGQRGRFNAYTDAAGNIVGPSMADYYRHKLAEPSSHGDGTVPTSSGNGLDVAMERNRNFNRSVMSWRAQSHEGVYAAEPVLSSVNIALHNFGVALFQKKADEVA